MVQAKISLTSGSLYSNGMTQIVNCKFVKHIDSIENSKVEKEKEECQMILALNW